MEEHSQVITETGKKLDNETVVRREFLKKVGRATATAPAIALLMAASAKPATAQDGYGAGGSTSTACECTGASGVDPSCCGSGSGSS